MSAIDTLRALPDVRRAWPGRDGSLTFETIDELGRLRAGEVTADSEVKLADYGVDPKLPELNPQLDGPIVVHRLHRRAVVLGADRVTKLLRAGRAEAVVQATQRFAALSSATGLAVPEVLSHSEARVDFSLLPGISLHDLGATGMAAWEYFAGAWPELLTRQAELPRHTGTQEAEVLQQWYQRVVDFQALPEIDQLRPLVERTCRELAATPGPLVIVHRDLHDKQLIWDGRSLGVIDLDTAALGEAALDLGNLLAHVDLRGIQGLWPDSLRTQITEVLTTVVAAAPTTAARLASYYRAALLRLACVYAFRPQASQWLPQWVAHCQERIEL